MANEDAVVRGGERAAYLADGWVSVVGDVDRVASTAFTS
jgi:hypothetical protein